MEWLGLEIHPETPPGGRELGEDFPEGRRRQLYERLNESGKQYGISFRSGGRVSNTHLALILGEYAKETGHFDVLHENLFKAYFEDGKDIGDRETLLQLAEGAGLSREEVEQAWQDQGWEERLRHIREAAEREAVTGTPTFVVNDKYRIVGALPYEEFQNALRRIKEEEDQ